MPRTPDQLARAAAEAEAWLDSLDPNDMPAEDTTDLRHIAMAVADVAVAEERLREVVVAARAAGRSWARIAMALGVSKQAARERFNEDVPTRQSQTG
jgi:hypothetical protein